MKPRRSDSGWVLVVALFLPSAGIAQDNTPPQNNLPQLPPPNTGSAAPSTNDPAAFGPGKFCSGWPYGPRVAPSWNYPNLSGGPFIYYPWGAYGYNPRSHQYGPNGLSLYGPAVPVYGPIPTIYDSGDLNRVRRNVPSPGMPFGWFGMFRASPRPMPPSVSVWARQGVEPVGTPPLRNAASQPVGGCLLLSVKLPQPAAEVFVDGVKTGQTGTDRLFESPPLEAGKSFRYEITARWIEGGVTREVKRAAAGIAGEVVKVDFTAAN